MTPDPTGADPTGTTPTTPLPISSAPFVAVAYYSGYGHTTPLAEAVRDGAIEAGAAAELIAVASISTEQWALLDAADAIVFGAPTYMGSAASAFHVFAESTSARWARRAWSDKLAAGFTMSGAMSGDKLHTLQYFAILAAQHGMHWINLDLPAGWNSSTGSEHDLNRLGFSLGAAGQSPIDVGVEGVSKADVETARHLGRRVASCAARLTARGHAEP
ncbi:flavodoxin family protein [Actinocrinis sp.]|uniref:flavodoxin family protein n=1 Tax=Actinocrinis sp. TaxID=1920516 RepID=UPI002D57C2E6|nr:NAD(P)H-dependent oxidoreductase [Actinocrinis sp.]HZP51742.1 NAD(P)H-dependent oxidoreductase [Actinocrinis sp.]